MMAISIDEGPEGFEHRTFDCLKCDHSEKQVIAVDPVKSSAVGWTAGEARPK